MNEPEPCTCENGYIVNEFDMKEVCKICHGEYWIYRDEDYENYIDLLINERRENG